jgi:hypothetical protein
MKQSKLFAILSALIMGALGVYLLFVGKPSLYASMGIVLLGGTMCSMWFYVILQRRN